jgi:hypothetical protein
VNAYGTKLGNRVWETIDFIEVAAGSNPALDLVAHGVGDRMQNIGRRRADQTVTDALVGPGKTIHRAAGVRHYRHVLIDRHGAGKHQQPRTAC